MQRGRIDLAGADHNQDQEIAKDLQINFKILAPRRGRFRKEGSDCLWKVASRRGRKPACPARQGGRGHRDHSAESPCRGHALEVSHDVPSNMARANPRRADADGFDHALSITAPGEITDLSGLVRKNPRWLAAEPERWPSCRHPAPRQSQQLANPTGRRLRPVVQPPARVLSRLSEAQFQKLRHFLHGLLICHLGWIPNGRP